MINYDTIAPHNAIEWIGKPVRIRPRFSDLQTFSTLRAFDTEGFVVDALDGHEFYSHDDYGVQGKRAEEEK